MNQIEKTQNIYEKGWLRYHLVVLFETIVIGIFLLPRFPLFNFIKTLFLRCLGAKIGKRVVFYPGIWIMPGWNLIIGDDVDLAYGVLITTRGGVSIGARTMIGYRAQILSGNHVIPPKPKRLFEAGEIFGRVNIKDDVWIGANSLILSGVTIGEGAVVAAGSVVTRNVPPFTIVGGCPAKIIKEREEQKSENVPR